MQKVNFNKSFLLIDTSYLIFHRFYAIRLWYSKANPEVYKELPKNHNWMEDKVFMERFEKTFFDGLKKIIKRKKIPFSNVIFGIDCKSRDIWRHNHVDNYKGNRAESHKRNNFHCFEIFPFVKNNLISNFINENNCHIIKVENAEADDVNAVIASILSRKTQEKIYIIASDTDYLQLCNDQLRIHDLKDRDISVKHIKDNCNSQKYLVSKILMGDASDNIKPCYISNNLIIDNINDNGYKRLKQGNYSKATRKLVNDIVSNTKIYQDLVFMLESNRYDSVIEDNITKNGQFKDNQMLIDFECIPDDIKNKVIEEFNNISD